MNTIKIVLTEEQARVLSWLLASVGGSLYNSGRRITKEISELLLDNNMGYTEDTEMQYPFDEDYQVIMFKDSD